MPIIFASSLLLFPSLIFQLLGRHYPGRRAGCNAARARSSAATRSPTTCLYVALIYFFCYFWTAITFNPKDMADNLKNYGTFIPGYRPGRRTADYLEKVMVRITYVGAGFLAVVAIIPDHRRRPAWTSTYGVASFYGGTGLLIAVSVAFDLVQKIDSHLVMRNYRGLLERSEGKGASPFGTARRACCAVLRQMRSPISVPRMTDHANRVHRTAGRRQRHAGRAAGATYRLAHLSTGDMLRAARDAQDRDRPQGRPSTCRPGNWCPTKSSWTSSGERLAAGRLPPGLLAGRLSADHRPGRSPRCDAASRRHAAGRRPGIAGARGGIVPPAGRPRPGRRSRRR